MFAEYWSYLLLRLARICCPGSAVFAPVSLWSRPLSRIPTLAEETSATRCYELFRFNAGSFYHYSTEYSWNSKVACATSACEYSWRSVRRGKPRTPITITASPEPTHTRGGVAGMATSRPNLSRMAAIVAACDVLTHGSTPWVIRSVTCSTVSLRRTIWQSPENMESARAKPKNVFM